MGPGASAESLSGLRHVQHQVRGTEGEFPIVAIETALAIDDHGELATADWLVFGLWSHQHTRVVLGEDVQGFADPVP
jgi:hypothetical protein